jgi:hypothetical protein
MRTPTEHIKTLQRRVEFLKSRPHQNSFDLAELGSLEWALVNLPSNKEEQDPDELTMAYLSGVHDGKKQRTWVGLTDEEVVQIRDDMTLDIRSHVDFYRYCEAKLKEKNA